MATLAREDHGRIVLANEPAFRLGALRVSPALRQVEWDGRHRTLEPRVMQVLIALARADETIVGRDLLVERCWDGRIVGENAINRVISLLRQLAAETQAFKIDTITKVGYRLSVHAETPPGEMPEAAPALPRFTVDRRGAIAAAGAIVAVAAASGWLLRPGRPASPAPDAERYFRAGVDSSRRGDANLRQTIAYFEQAVRADPRYAAAWGALARALTALADTIDENEKELVLRRAGEAANRALALDPHNADALTAKVLSEPWFRNWARLEAIANDVLAVRPDLNVVRLKLAISMANTGRFADALRPMQHLVSAEPLVPIHQTRHAWLLWQTGRPDMARRVFDNAYRTWPGDMWVWTTRCVFLSLTGAADDALAMIREDGRTSRAGPLSSQVAGECAQALRQGGSSDDRRRAVAAIEAARRQGDLASFISVLYLPALGEVGMAFDHAYAYLLGRRDPLTGERKLLPREAERWTDFLFAQSTAPMRSDPRFPQLTAAIGLDDYWRITGSRPDFRAA